MSESSPVHKLALEISSCDDVFKAHNDESHPCHTVVSWQAKKWTPEISLIAGSRLHRPEAWTGNLTKAPILFLASNPSFNPEESFPDYSENWDDDKIADFALRRFTPDSSRGFGAIDMPNVEQADRVILSNGQVQNGGPVPYWREIRGRVSEILDKPKNEVSADLDYAMTELVHCKTFKEIGVEEAISNCYTKWAQRVFEISPAKLIVVMGKKPAEKLLRIFPSIPDYWGAWKDVSSGNQRGDWPKSNPDLIKRIAEKSWGYEQQKKHSFEIEIGGKKRLLIWIPRPNSSMPRSLAGVSSCISSELMNEWRTYISKTE